MLRRLYPLLLIALGAIAGALAGRITAELRRRAETGEELSGALDQISLNPRTLSPRELVPGIVAAVRVRDVPWCYLNLPPWMAAMSVNFGTAALAHELAQLDQLIRDNSWATPPWAADSWDGEDPVETQVEVHDVSTDFSESPADSVS